MKTNALLQTFRPTRQGMVRGGVAVSLALGLAACAAPKTPEEQIAAAAAAPLPEGVIALADPAQNLATARLRPEDGCYWYLYSGPVETTLLPLRTPAGKPICMQIEPAAS